MGDTDEPMKINVIGAKGMLGSDLAVMARADGFAVSEYDLPELDIVSGNGFDALKDCDWLVNCAAYTNVDGAEKEADKAFAVNRDGVSRLASWCSCKGAGFLSISTDYVFDGRLDKPLTEDDPVNPLSVYGKSKLAGEQEMQKLCDQYIIVRTQSLFGKNGPNFVKAIMSQIKNGKKQIDVVRDQISCPTYTKHLSLAILRLLKKARTGIVHVSSSGSCSWFEFAEAIAAKTGSGAEVRPVEAQAYGRPAERPARSVLDKGRYEAWTGEKMPRWEEGLDAYLSEIGELVIGREG